MTEKQEKKSAKPGVPEISQDVRDYLRESLGVEIPEDMGTEAGGKRLWGYKCASCGKIGLEFVGGRWTIQTPDGPREVHKPPLNVPMERLPWVQDKGRYREPCLRRPRSQPACQHCYNALFTKGQAGTVKPQYVVSLKDYEQKQAAKSRRRGPMPYYAEDAAAADKQYEAMFGVKRG